MEKIRPLTDLIAALCRLETDRLAIIALLAVVAVCAYAFNFAGIATVAAYTLPLVVVAVFFIALKRATPRD